MSTSIKSLKRGDTAAARRVVASEAGALTAAPAATDVGLATGGHEYLHIDAVAGGSGTFDLILWGRRSTSDRWGIITWFGTAGTKASIGTSGFFGEPVAIRGIEFIAFQTANVGVACEPSVWAGASSSSSPV